MGIAEKPRSVNKNYYKIGVGITTGALLALAGIADKLGFFNENTHKPNPSQSIPPSYADTGIMPSQSIQLVEPAPQKAPVVQIPTNDFLQQELQAKPNEEVKKEIKQLTADIKEITEDMIKPASLEQVDTLQKQAIEKGENKIPAPVKGEYKEIELKNGVKVIVVNLTPGTYTIWMPQDTEILLKSSDSAHDAYTTNNKALTGTSFRRVYYSFPKKITSFPTLDAEKIRILATLTIPDHLTQEDEKMLEKFRAPLLNLLKNEKDRKSIENAYLTITSSSSSGGVNKEPMLGRIFLTDSQNQVLSLHSGK